MPTPNRKCTAATDYEKVKVVSIKNVFIYNHHIVQQALSYISSLCKKKV